MSYADDLAQIAAKIEELETAYAGAEVNLSTHQIGNEGATTEYVVTYKLPNAPTQLQAAGSRSNVINQLQNVIDLA